MMKTESELNLEVARKLRVCTDAEAEEATFHVCGPEPFRSDDVKGECALCNAVIYWAMDSPKKPKRICGKCLLIETKGAGTINPTMRATDLKELALKIFRDLTKK